MSDEKNRPPKKMSKYLSGFILIVIGVLLILRGYLDFNVLEKLWPLLLLLPVVALSRTLMKAPKNNSGLLVPILTLVIYSVYILWLNFSGWNNVSYTWPTFFMAPGLGFLTAYLISREKGMLIPGGILCLIGVAVYGRLIFTRFGIEIDRFLVAGIILVGVGIIVIVTRRKNNSQDG